VSQESPDAAMQSPILLTLSAAASSGSAPQWTGILPMVAIVAVFWFLILRPQMKRQKEHAAKVQGIKKGDQVLTGGGFVGKVTKVIDDHYAEVELGTNLKVKVLKSTIADIIPPGGAAAND
jgi:preprotein translocase subunit YajC